MKKFIQNYYPEFGLAVGTVIATIVTTIVCLWEWLENPGGIFRDENGTNWQFVYETAWSWFLPTFIHTVVVLSLVHLVWKMVGWIWTRFDS